jgi:hypothetical protein
MWKATALLVLIAGCYAPRFQDCYLRCETETGCPDGLTCLGDGFCHRPAEEPSCGVASPDAAVDDLDASPADASGPDAVPCDPFTPVEARCDGRDDDCDEEYDEGCWQTGTASVFVQPMAPVVGNHYTPRLTADGRYLVFSAGGSVWVSPRAGVDAPFGAAIRVFTAAVETGTIISADLSTDLKELFLDIAIADTGERDLFVARRSTVDVPFDPEQRIPGLNMDAVIDRHPHLSRDGRELLFSSNRSGTDLIYRSLRALDEVGFGPPELLELPEVGGVMAPFLSADGMTMFYARKVSDTVSTLAYAIRVAPASLGFRASAELPGLSFPGKQNTYPSVDTTTGEVFFISDRPWSPNALFSIWRARLCGEGRCPSPTISCDDGVTSPDGRHCYVLVAGSVAWATSEQVCQTNGGHLASIHSVEEHTLISTLTAGAEAWVGAHDQLSECNLGIPGCVFSWLSGEPWNYAPWYPGQPDDVAGAEECVTTYLTTVVDRNCASPYELMVCENEIWPW